MDISKQDIMSAGYVMIPSRLLFDEQLSDKEKIVYAFLAAFIDDSGGYCWLTNAEIAGYLNVSREFISRAINKLKKLNYLEVNYTYINNIKAIKKRLIYLK